MNVEVNSQEIRLLARGRPLYKTNLRNALYITLFLVIILAIWMVLIYVPGPTIERLPSDTQGKYDLTSTEMNNKVYRAANVWDSWPNELYDPEELESANDPVSYESIDHSTVQYATYRLIFNVEPGISYGISLGNPTYAMRVYLDGEEVEAVGIPGTTAEQTVPQEVGTSFFFTPQNATVEIVVQTSNFVHAQSGAEAPKLTIGTAENISQFDTNQTLQNGLFFGCLLTAGLYHLAIFLLNRRQIAALLFALACLLHAFVSTAFIRLLFPSIDWQIAVRCEYILFMLTVALLILLMGRLFPGALHTGVSRAYLIICGVYLVIVLVTDTLFFTSLLHVFQALSIAMAAYVLVCLIVQIKKNMTAQGILALTGVAAVAVLGTNEVFMRNNFYLFNVVPENSIGVSEGMIFFVFCYAVLLSIEQSEINDQILEAKHTLAAAQAHYEEQLNSRTNGQPSVALSHFELTKRETEVAFLLLDGKSRENVARILSISLGTVNFHCSNIYRKTGVNSLMELTKLVSSNGEVSTPINQ